MVDLPGRTLRRATAAVSGMALAVAGLAIAAPVAHAANGVPRFDHVIVVMEENHSYNEVIGATGAPYINNTLAAGGAVFTNSFAIEHPSEPNYLDLFSGSNQGVTSDSCPETFSADNEGAQLLAAGDTFAGYSEGLPSAGSTVCTSGEYARKHVPWTNFTNVPASDSVPFTSFPSSSNYASLPTVSWVIPNLLDDMHDGTIAQGDTWLQNNMNSYATWAKAHNSLLIVTWDEDDSSQSNQIPTIFYGANVQTGQYANMINHYSVLRTIEDMYGLPYAGAAANATPITNVWGTASNTVTVSNPGNQTGAVGAAASLQIAAKDSASGQTLTYSATGLPAGLSINSSTGLISGTPTAAGTSNVTVSAKDTTGASGATSFTWTVNPRPDFTLSVSPTSGTVTAGSSASATVSTSAVGGFSGTVSYSATGLPSGASAGFSPTSGAVGSSSTLTVSTSGSTPAGTYPVTVTGTAGSLTHSATYSLTVNPVAANTVTVTNPGNQTGAVGTAASLHIAATDSASGQTLTYSATGLPAGLSINSSTGLISGTPTAASTSDVTVTATDTTGASGSTSFTWTVNAAADFSISVSPTSGTVTAGSAASTAVSTSAIGGFSGTVSFGASGLPSGASATFNPTSATAGGGSTLTIGTSSSTPAGSYPITITGASGSLSHSTTFTLTVNPVQQNTVTVTNPGNQTGTVGTAASLQIAAKDSGSGQTLTYSATGLPAGLSINSSSGLISGTPTTVGTSKATVTATDTTGASGTASFTWTIAASGGGCTAAQLLGDPGFENGTNSAPWTASSGVINNDTTSEPSHSGSWDAWLDGYGTTHTDTLAQTVAIPTGCTSANFSFWLHIDTAETGTTAYDTLKVQVLNSSGTVLGTLDTFSNVKAISGYAQHTYSLAPYVGQTVTLKFTGSEDYELQTSFVIDDTALNVA